jgi:surfactin synthase thioesterase subunit
VIPTLRADLAVYADFVDDERQVPCPVAAYGATDDPLLEPGCMRTWASRTTRFLGLSEFRGGHFYLMDHAMAITADLVRHLRRLTTRDQP